MNVFKFHSNPEKSKRFKELTQNSPAYIWDKYKDEPDELKKYEHVIATSSKFSFKYASEVLKGPFKLGEPAIAKIAKNAKHAYYYSIFILNGPFKLGEPAIATSSAESYFYATQVLKHRFELGEPAILAGIDKSFYLLFLKNSE